MRIVFLDFDGVLNSHAYLTAPGHAWDGNRGTKETGVADEIDPAAVGRLNRIVRETGAEVVVSSSWRHGRSVVELTEILRARGFDGRVRAKTPDFVPNTDELSKRSCGERGDEIAAWLATDGEVFGVETFVVLDDSADMNGVHHRFIQTDFHHGLLDEHVDRAIAMLTEAT